LRNFKSNRCYHLISRIANRAFFLTEEERSRFVARMWRVAEFSGIGVLAYCFMGNHFHLLVYLPEARKLDDGELFDRIASLYQGVRLSEIRQEWDMCVRTGDEPGKQSFRERFFRRMYDVSAFMKTLKQNSTMSYNSHIVPWEQIREMHEKSIHLVLRELEDEIPLWGHSLQGFLLCCINRQKSRCCWRFSCFENFPHKILISRLRFRFAGSVPA
ncbi:MAG: transposase, partial [Kiritimatiellae bacterium]|nr:transposase [Kiritimatiellia bacterium]